MSNHLVIVHFFCVLIIIKNKNKHSLVNQKITFYLLENFGETWDICLLWQTCDTTEKIKINLQF